MKLNRSLLIAVTLAYIVALASGFAVARVIATKSEQTYVTPTFEAMDRLELEEATSAYEAGGRAALKVYMLRLDRAFSGRHYLLSADGTDLTTGNKTSGLLPKPPATRYRTWIDGEFHLAQQSNDGRYWFAATGSSTETGPATWVYFIVCAVVTTGLLFFSLLYLVFPLRHIRDAMHAFGHGAMDRRIHSSRQDEIGQLTASFNTMAERIEHSFRTERLLLQDVSHELRAPLARLGLAVRLAKESRSEELLTQIESNVTRLSALVAEITAFHQASSEGESDQPLADVKLDELVQQLIHENAFEASSRAVELHLTAMPVIVSNARPDLIGRAIGNILRNAILHSGRGERVDITVSRESANAVVSVRDYGRGIPDEALEQIFEPFYREEASSSSYAGLGLGLSIARRGAQWHGGTLHAENASPGLRMVATFPLRDSTVHS